MGCGRRHAALGRGLCLADGQRGRLGCWRFWRRGRCRVARPAQAPPRVIDHLRVGVEEFVREDCQLVVVQGELELQGVIGHPAAPLEEGYDLVEDVIQIHHSSSTWARAASAWGSQKVIAMVRYRAMAVDSSVGASASRPILVLPYEIESTVARALVTSCRA